MTKSGKPAGSVHEPSRSDTAAQTLRADIFAGHYPPGTPLREIRIARELGVSQATVREGLQKLEREGLVTRTPNIGTSVVRLSPKDIRERVQLRADLEIQAARLAADRMGQAEYRDLEQRLAILKQAVQKDAHYEAAQADLEFHRYIWRCSGNTTLAALLEQLAIPLFAFVSLLRHSGLEHLPDVVAAHEPLLEALRSKDDARIEQAFRLGATESYRQYMDTGRSANKAFAFGWMTTGD
jgi:DNA-binding GntR family transcriptional regulator